MISCFFDFLEGINQIVQTCKNSVNLFTILTILILNKVKSLIGKKLLRVNTISEIPVVYIVTSENLKS